MWMLQLLLLALLYLHPFVFRRSTLCYNVFPLIPRRPLNSLQALGSGHECVITDNLNFLARCYVPEFWKPAYKANIIASPCFSERTLRTARLFLDCPLPFCPFLPLFLFRSKRVIWLSQVSPLPGHFLLLVKRIKPSEKRILTLI